MTVPIGSVEDDLRAAIVQTGTNTSVIFVPPNAPRPELPYTCIEYLMTEQHAFDYTSFDTDTNSNCNYGHRVLIFTVTCYGNNALDEANTLNARCTMSSFGLILKEASTNSVAVANVSAVNYNYVMREDAYEKTADFDIILNVVLEDGSTTEDTGYFDEVSDPQWSNF